MFGYVKVNSPELKVKEYEYYKGAYCGLCRSMGKCTGQCSRMTLNYDFVFLAMFRIGMEKTPVSFEQKRCLAHPLKKRNSMRRNPALEYCANAAALLNYHKIMDDLADEKGFKKIRALLAKPFVTRARKKALRAGLSELDTRIAQDLRKLSELEAQKMASVDAPAEVFGDILADIVSYGLEGCDARIASTVGKGVGKWIYIIDALDDLEDDAKKERYNPFLLLYDGMPKKESLMSMEDALKNELCDVEAAIDLIDFDNEMVQNIICNILYIGCPAKVREILCGSDEKKKLKNRKDGLTDD
ncbi:MAG: hypothetical protein E7670_03440 [Ruminococcaceae bacterium]|nr:hypothetical protein [Oscillospiraceae bacterium]